MRPGAAALLLVAVASPANAEETHLRYVPSDTKAVLTIHYPALSEADRGQARELMDRLYRTHLVPELGKDAKLPVSEVSRIVFALPYAGSLGGVFLIRGKIDRKLFDQQVQEVAKATDALSVERMGRPAEPVYTRRLDQGELVKLLPPLAKVPAPFRKLVAPQEAHFAVMDGETLLVSLSGKKQVERALRARTAGDRLRVSDELAAVLRKQDPKDHTAGVLVEDSLHPGLALVADEATRETFGQFDYVTLRIRGHKDVQITVEIKGKSEDVTATLEARSKRALEKLRELLPTLVADKEKRAVLDALLKSFKVSRKDDRVTLVGTLSEADGRKLMAPRE
jgi:hypothetical protein